MSRTLRVGALLIALAGVMDPAVALQSRAPVPVEVLLPPAHDPTFAEADRIRASLLRQFGDTLDPVSSEPPRTIVTIGNAVPPEAVAVPVLAVRLDSPRLSAVATDAAEAIQGQQQVRHIRFEGHRLAGQSTEFVLRRGEARVGAVSHRWAQDDEVFDARFEFVSPATGFDSLRITASTDALADITVDVPVLASARKLRVLFYEPRPSWSAAFVRMAVEADPSFEVRSVTSTSKAIATVSAKAPGSLVTADPDTLDAIAVGGLDQLTAADLGALDRFASLRGGTVILFPDARVPDRAGSAFDLPVLDEVLIDRPVDVQSAVSTLRASEFLLPRSPGAKYRPLATVIHAGAQRTAVGVLTRGAGQIVVAGVLDGWRYRGEKEGAFARFWRGTIADAAFAAPPRLSLQVEPLIAPPGHALRLRAILRRTEWDERHGTIQFPSLTATVVALNGPSRMVRLWPAAVPGVYDGSLPAPDEGRYTARVEGTGMAAETPVVIDRTATPVTSDRSGALARLARSSGGATFDSQALAAVVARLQQIQAPRVEHRVHPMRSGWWMLPFALLLGTEWAIRRRQGLR